MSSMFTVQNVKDTFFMNLNLYLCFALIQVRKLDAMFNAAMLAVNSCEKLHGCTSAHHTPCLQRRILDYFNKDDNCNVSNKMGQSRLVQVFICD